MFDIYFIVSLLIFSILCFLEFIVFNEEILLALCFFSFVFFCFNLLSDSVFLSFQERATKFESDLLVSFNAIKQSTLSSFDSFLNSRGFSLKTKILLTNINSFFSVLTNYSKYAHFFLFSSICYTKLTELRILNDKLFLEFQKKTISLLLYPLIFQTTKNNLNFLTAINSNITSSLNTKLTNNKISMLKSLTV
jgi:hypothetical protein